MGGLHAFKNQKKKSGAALSSKASSSVRRNAALSELARQVDLVKRSLKPFMNARYPGGGGEYRTAFSRICRRISEGLTEANRRRLLQLSEEETGDYWISRAGKVEAAVKKHFAVRHETESTL